jgi:O-antigen/teichoic acid export membrane protein
MEGQDRENEVLILGADTQVTFRQHARFYLSQSAIYGIGYMVARVLGVLFSVVVARAFGPADFGVVRYAISVAGLATIVVGSLPTMLSRYLATYRNDPKEVDRYFTNGFALISVILLFTLIGTGWYLQGEPFSALLGTLLVASGLAAFNTYMELSRGLDNISRMAGYYVTANFLQLVVIVACVWVLGIRSVGLALAIYGLSFIIPIGIFELRAQSPVHLRPRLITFVTMWQLSRFSVPLVIAYAGYTVWGSLDLLLVEQRLGSQSAGIYAVAKTAVMVFILVPYAVTAVALRYFARGSPREAQRSMLLSLGAATGASTLLVAGFWAFSGPLIRVIFGQPYSAAAQPLIILAVGMALYTVYLVFETWMIAKGYPWLHALAMSITLVSSTTIELALLPHWGLAGVALGVTVGITAGNLIIAGLYGWLMMRETRARSNYGKRTQGSTMA